MNAAMIIGEQELQLYCGKITQSIVQNEPLEKIFGQIG